MNSGDLLQAVILGIGVGLVNILARRINGQDWPLTIKGSVATGIGFGIGALIWPTVSATIGEPWSSVVVDLAPVAVVGIVAYSWLRVMRARAATQVTPPDVDVVP